MTPDNFVSVEGIVWVFQWLLFGLMVVYFIFAFILMREVALMNRTFSSSWAPVFRFLARLHFLIVLLLTVVALLILLL